MSTAGHEIALLALGSIDPDGRLTLFIGSVGDHEAREPRDFVDFFVERDAFLEILELHGAADFGEDCVGVGIPFRKLIAES